MDQAEASPTEDALDRIGRLAASGASRQRIAEAVGGIVAAWAGEPEMDAAGAQARIEAMWDSLGKDAADLEAAISDAGEGEAGEGEAGDLAAARRTLAALHAAVAVLVAAHDRL